MARKYTLESFPKEFFDIWDLAAEGKLRIPLESKGFGTNMKQRLYAFRRLVSPEQSSRYYQTDLKVEGDDTNGYFLIAFVPPWKAAVRQQLKEALSEGTLGSESPADPSPPGDPAPDPMDQSLANLGFGTHQPKD